MESTNRTVSSDYPWHQTSWDYYVKARSQKRLPHALLISGDNGIGKKDFATRMVKSLLCIKAYANFENGIIDKPEACNNCQACKTFDAQANPDYLSISLLEDKQQISVDQIRQLSNFLNYSRSFNTCRVVLIDQIERMNKNAANSLLKSLEEPTNNTFILLLANQTNTLLPTIKSRCQFLPLNTPDTAQALAWMQQQPTQIENPEMLLAMAYGKPVAALNIPKEEIQSKTDFENDLLGLINQQQAITVLAKKWEKYDSEQLINWQINWAQDLIKASITQEQNTQKTADTVANITEINSRKSEIELWKIYQELIKQKKYIHTSVNSQMFIENMLMLWCP